MKELVKKMPVTSISSFSNNVFKSHFSQDSFKGLLKYYDVGCFVKDYYTMMIFDASEKNAV